MLYATMLASPYITVETSARRRCRQDIVFEADTPVVFSYREGVGVGQHPNSNRGASTVNFATGAVEISCENSRRFASLHGALMLIAWMFVAPAGIYYIRCARGTLLVYSLAWPLAPSLSPPPLDNENPTTRSARRLVAVSVRLCLSWIFQLVLFVFSLGLHHYECVEVPGSSHHYERVEVPGSSHYDPRYDKDRGRWPKQRVWLRGLMHTDELPNVV